MEKAESTGLINYSRKTVSWHLQHRKTHQHSGAHVDAHMFNRPFQSEDMTGIDNSREQAEQARQAAALQNAIQGVQIDINQAVQCGADKSYSRFSERNALYVPAVVQHFSEAGYAITTEAEGTDTIVRVSLPAVQPE